MRETFGASSFRISTRFAVNSVLKVETPVILPPGCAKLATSVPGAPMVAMTTGTEGVVFLAAFVAGAPRHDKVDLEADQFRCEVGEALSATVRRPIFEDQVLTFDIAEIPQPL